MSEVVGYVVLTKRADVAEPWLCDHSGDLWDYDAAVDEAAGWGNDNPEYEVVVARVVVDGAE